MKLVGRNNFRSCRRSLILAEMIPHLGFFAANVADGIAQEAGVPLTPLMHKLFTYAPPLAGFALSMAEGIISFDRTKEDYLGERVQISIDTYDAITRRIQETHGTSNGTRISAQELRELWNHKDLNSQARFIAGMDLMANVALNVGLGIGESYGGQTLGRYLGRLFFR